MTGVRLHTSTVILFHSQGGFYKRYGVPIQSDICTGGDITFEAISHQRPTAYEIATRAHACL